MSGLSWLDYSEKDRRRTLEFIETFRERDTRDELGIGLIRDAFSELLFPGTTTVQTRVRYFLLIPWAYLRVEAYARGGAARSTEQVAGRARELEVATIRALLAGDDKDGVLGRDARELLKQLPSRIYWQGLGVWGIRRFPGSRAQLHRELARASRVSGPAEFRDPDEDVAPVGTRYANWHEGLPDPPADVFARTSFKLRPEDAYYLRDRILSSTADTLLAHLVATTVTPTDVEAPWLHPGWAEFSPVHREQLYHGRVFATVIRGATLLYNLMLARKKSERVEASLELVHAYEQKLEEWRLEMEELSGELDRWAQPSEQARFWALVESTGARVVRTRRFVENWVDIALGDRASVKDDPSAQRLIRDREVGLKRGLARLENPHALEGWSEASGIGPITYRWSTVQTFMNDIAAGLGGEDAAAD